MAIVMNTASMIRVIFICDQDIKYWIDDVVLSLWKAFFVSVPSL